MPDKEHTEDSITAKLKEPVPDSDKSGVIKKAELFINTADIAAFSGTAFAYQALTGSKENRCSVAKTISDDGPKVLEQLVRVFERVAPDNEGMLINNLERSIDNMNSLRKSCEGPTT